MKLGGFRTFVAASVLAAGSWASAAGHKEDLQNQISELQDKVEALQAREAASSQDLAASIDSLLRDAERRSQLLATSGEAAAGYDKGFFIKAGDAWVLRPGAQFQFRNVSNYREGAKGGDESSFDNGFELRRMKFEMAGNAFTKDLEYLFLWQTDRNSGSLILEEAWARYFLFDQWGLRAGQFKDLVTHEFLMSTKRLIACDGSLMDAAIGGTTAGWTQGVTLIYGGARSDNNPLNIEVGYTDGASQLNTDFTGRGEPLATPTPTVAPVGTAKAHVFDWGIAGRIEYLAMGHWIDYRDFTAKGTKDQMLVIGAGADWSQGGAGDLVIATLDAQYENTNGLGLYAAGVVHYLSDDMNSAGLSATDWGALAQASYLLPGGNWEVFGRYDITLLQRDIVFSDTQDNDAFHELTVGVNYYLGQNGSAGHRAKVTVDLNWLPNGAPASFTGMGVLDKNGAENELVLRAQFQLLI